MKVPIPNDWDGESWECVQILWPNSPQFWGLLNGLLTLMTRGRYWEENTGSIIDMQAIAWEIFNANYPYTNCNDEPIPPVTPGDTVCFGGGAEDDEENLMGSFITNITCEDGVMYLHYGPCCKIAMTCDFSTIQQPPPEDTNPDPEDPTTWACNKSSGMAITFYDVIVEVVDAISPFVSVYDMFTPCYNVIKRYGAVWANAQQICAAYIADKSAIDVMAADPETPEKIACIWSPLLLATDNLNTDEFWSMQTSFTVKFSAAENNFLVPMVIAIAYSNFAWWARLFHDSLANCDCPQEGYEASPVWFSGEYVGPSGGDFTPHGPFVSESGRRWNARFQCSGGGDKSFTDLEPVLLGGQVGDVIRIRVYPTPGEGDWARVPANVSGLTVSEIVESQYGDHDIDSSPSGQTRFNGVGYVEWEQNIDENNSPQNLDIKGWKYPIATTETMNWRWTMEIVAVNGVEFTPLGP